MVFFSKRYSNRSSSCWGLFSAAEYYAFGALAYIRRVSEDSGTESNEEE